MSYTKDFLEEEKAEFISLIKSIDREGAAIDLLLERLEETDFYKAPASTRYHNNCEGGLLDHSLNVYKNLKSLVKSKGLEETIPEDSIIICGLLHDLSKINYYTKTAKNKKVYTPNGSKRDELGNFDWVSEMGYVTKPADSRFLYGSHEQNSEFMVRSYIPLCIEESMAILHHHAGMGYDSVPAELGPIWATYPLVLLLHLADMIASYVDEGVE